MDSYVSKPLAQLLAGVGLLYLSAKVFSYLRLLASLFLLPGASLSKFGPKGSWAVVTGASDGIGKEFALQLARKGYNLVLVSRTQSKLESLATEIKSANPKVETKVLAMDYSANRDSDYEALKALTSDLDISILINNVGQSHSIPVPFLETDPSEMNAIITINVTGTLRTTALIAPGMVSRKRGLILSMASFGGVFPTPLLATYSGSKAFLQHWGTALGAELAPSNVTVQVVQSHLVASAMSKIRRSSAMVPTPKAFVRTTLGKIGRSGGSQGIAYTMTPWWSHALMQWVVGTFVGTMGYLTLGQNKTMHESIRKRALAKAAREAKKQ
ncbi:NAD(P)-binding protein [Microthyrium microscopicum]|uniref:Very-long-chain 3-oxoacyl-CoA reductase n=1 Tax=Microthyrium microscopicum TaxID=703497 RepID=A0A6A6URI1_9PEZI|nr:NAD(P)-binding protein [Microthyrium microscopicum]